MITEFKEKYEEIAERKRRELAASLEAGDIADPFTIAGVVITWQAIAVSAAVSAAAAVASYGLSRAFAPKPPRVQQGKLTGSLQLQNSEQGIFIPEIYGASPTISLTAGSNPTYQNVANCTTGAGGSITKNAGGSAWNAGASHNVSIASGDAFFEFTVGTGYATAGFTNTASPTSGNTDFLFGAQWNPDGSVTIKYSGTQLVANVTHWVTGDRFRVEIREGRFRLYKGSAEIRPANFVPPTPTYPCYAGIAIQYVGAGISEAKVKIGSIGSTPNAGRGGIKVPAIIVYSSKIRKNVSVTQQPTGGGKGGHPTQTVENITYDIDLGLAFGKGENSLLRLYANADVLLDQVNTSLLPTGVYDPTVGPDDPFDPFVPPDPNDNYIRPIHRENADIAFDVDLVGSGTIQGGTSLFAIYPGNETQDPDPTIESDIDAQFGSGSTPAYRGHTLIVLKQFLLTRWGGIVPNFTAVWEHSTLKTFGPIFGALCERVGVLAANSDYDFTALTGACRGLLIAGRPFRPAEIIGSSEIQLAGNFFVTEAEGQIIGYAEGGEPSVTIPDTKIGWLDNDADDPEVIPEVDSILASEISLARQVDVKFIDPDNEWDANTQSAKRQITEGVGVELVEVQLCLLADEARAMAQRKLYRDYVAGSAHRFTLSWEYLYLYPGYKIIITRAEGFTHTLRLTSISGGLGILECEGVALEPSVFTQPAPTVIPGNDPNKPVPAMTIVALLDTPLLRDGDETNNQGIGFYMGGTPRTGFNQSWTGFALYINRNNTWTPLETSELPATIGTVVSVTGLNTTDTSVIDYTGVITVDLYGTTAALTSVTEETLRTIPNINLALIGSMVIQFATATQVAGFQNRWDLSVLLNGRRGTESNVTDTFTGSRFVLIDGAVKFVPMEVADIGSTASYRAVTSGQSLDDAATVSFAWTGETLKPLAPVNLRGTRNADGDLFIECTRRSRFAVGMIPKSDVPLGEELEMYDLELLTTGDVLKRTMRVIPGGAQAAILLPVFPQDSVAISGNNALGQTAGIGVQQIFAQQQIANSGGWVEATLQIDSTLSHSVSMELRLPSEIAIAPSRFYHVGLSNGTGENVITIGNEVTSFLYETTIPLSIRSVRIRMVVVGSEVRFYWDYMGPGSVPIYVAANSLPLPLTPRFSVSATASGSSKATNIYVGSNLSGPSTIYSAAQQTADGFTPNVSLIKCIWYQISSIVGRGRPLTGIL